MCGILKSILESEEVWFLVFVLWLSSYVFVYNLFNLFESFSSFMRDIRGLVR